MVDHPHTQLSTLLLLAVLAVVKTLVVAVELVDLEFQAKA
jgi:hypothetical protein